MSSVRVNSFAFLSERISIENNWHNQDSRYKFARANSLELTFSKNTLTIHIVISLKTIPKAV